MDERNERMRKKNESKNRYAKKNFSTCCAKVRKHKAIAFMVLCEDYGLSRHTVIRAFIEDSIEKGAFNPYILARARRNYQNYLALLDKRGR
ncbi:MAG: hypothetical protein LBL09_04770 [Oscillospiraceae bacterium]|jgi:hypothetical protein|nr:hypothetical protein [Oscillospiraceae bacterium]